MDLFVKRSELEERMGRQSKTIDMILDAAQEQARAGVKLVSSLEEIILNLNSKINALEERLATLEAREK